MEPNVDYLDIPDYECLNNSNISDYSYCDPSSYWCEAGEQELTIKMFQTCVFCLIFLLGIVGNCLVIATFTRYRRRLRSMTDTFLLHLALADLLLLLTLPLQATETHLGWIFSAPLCKTMRTCYAINTYSGLLLLAGISVDRYLMVARAQDMFRLRRQILRGGKMGVVCVWMVALMVSLPEILFSEVSVVLTNNGMVEHYCGMTGSGSVKMAANGAIIGVFCLTFLIMAICYSLIARMLWRGSARRQGKRWQQKRTLKLILALVLVFLLFQLPYTVVLSRKMTGQFCGLFLEYVTCTLAYTRCCLNPILYALVGFRKDVLRRFRASGCRCWPRVVLPTLNSTSTTPCSPTVPEHSYSSKETTRIPTKSLEPNDI